MKTPIAVSSCLVALSFSLLAAEPIRVMLLDGESGGSYHAWQQTTPVLKKELEETGLFQVDVVTIRPSSFDSEPSFAKYSVVVFNYDAQAWPTHLQSSFEQYVKNGGGFV